MGWLTGWEYRRELTVTEQSGSDLTDFQVLIILDSTNFDFSKANADGSDIRFTTDDGTTLLDHWIEYWDSANAKARIWIKIPSILANGSVTVYTYYGNSSATDTSNASLVFDYWEDFTSGFPADWKVSTGSWSGEAPTYIKTTGSYGNRAYYKGASYAPPIVIESMEKPASDTKGNTNILMGFQSDGNNYRIVANSSRDVLRIIKAVSGTSTVLATYDYAVNSVWFFTSVRWDSSGNITASFYLADTYQKITDIFATDTTYTSGHIGLGGYSKENLKDWIRVRKYANTEPTVSIGTEETQTVVETILITESISMQAIPKSNIGAGLSDSVGMVDGKAGSISGFGLIDSMGLSDARTGKPMLVLPDAVGFAEDLELTAAAKVLELLALSGVTWGSPGARGGDGVTVTATTAGVAYDVITDAVTLTDVVTAIEQILIQTQVIADGLGLSVELKADVAAAVSDLILSLDKLKAAVDAIHGDLLTLVDAVTAVELITIITETVADSINVLDSAVSDAITAEANALLLSPTVWGSSNKFLMDYVGVDTKAAGSPGSGLVDAVDAVDVLTAVPDAVVKEIIPLLEEVVTHYARAIAVMDDVIGFSEVIGGSISGFSLSDAVSVTDSVELLKWLFAREVLRLYSRITVIITVNSVIMTLKAHRSIINAVAESESAVVDVVRLRSILKEKFGG